MTFLDINKTLYACRKIKKEMGRFLYRFHLFSIVMHQSYDAFKPNEIYIVKSSTNAFKFIKSDFSMQQTLEIHNIITGTFRPFPCYTNLNWHLERKKLCHHHYTKINFEIRDRDFFMSILFISAQKISSLPNSKFILCDFALSLSLSPLCACVENQFCCSKYTKVFTFFNEEERFAPPSFALFDSATL